MTQRLAGTWLTAGALVGLAAVAWAVTVRQTFGMGSMGMGLIQVATGASTEIAAPIFMAMWLTMTTAMMFPTVVPVVLAHRMVVEQRGEGALPTTSFVFGYVVVWTAIGLVPLLALLSFQHAVTVTGLAAWLGVIAGVVLIGAGAYQFTRIKTVCLRRCRSPLEFVLTHDFGAGAPGAFRAGVAHGAYCVGCCWALMTVLVMVGLMNLVWMAGLTILFLAEKNWHRGLALSRLAGAAVIVLGAVLIVHPAWLMTVVGG